MLTPEDSALAPVDEHASDLIARMVMAQPGEIILIAIGPLTNVALTMLKEPRLARALGGLVIMGGVVGGAGALHLPWTEHNFRSDPEAAQIVLASGAPMAIVPLDRLLRRCASGRWGCAPGGSRHAVPRRRGRSGPAVSPLPEHGLDLPARSAGGRVCHPAGSCVKWESLHAVVETGGTHTAGKLLVKPPGKAAPATAKVAALGVAVQEAEHFILGRLAT